MTKKNTTNLNQSLSLKSRRGFHRQKTTRNIRAINALCENQNGKISNLLIKTCLVTAVIITMINIHPGRIEKNLRIGAVIGFMERVNHITPEKNRNIFLDLNHGIRSGCGQSRQRPHVRAKPHVTLLGLSSLILRDHHVLAWSLPSERRPFFVPGRQTGGKSLVTSRKVTDMKNARSCADGAYGAPRWRTGLRAPAREWITLTAEDCRLLDRVRKPGQTHTEAFRELLNGYGREGGVA